MTLGCLANRHCEQYLRGDPLGLSYSFFISQDWVFFLFEFFKDRRRFLLRLFLEKEVSLFFFFFLLFGGKTVLSVRMVFELCAGFVCLLCPMRRW